MSFRSARLRRCDPSDHAEMHDWFVDTGVEPENIFELDWWDSVDVPPAADDTESVVIHAVPAQHNSGPLLLSRLD